MPWDPDDPFPSSAALGETDSGARNLAEFLCSLLQPGPVLSIGASETALQAARDHEVIAVDWNHRRLHRLAESAAARGQEVRTVCRDPQRQDLRIVRGGVRNIICVDVLERLESDLAVLQKLHGALSPGGTFVVRVRSCPWVREETGPALRAVRAYDEASLREVLEEAGFVVRRLRHWNFVGVPFAFFWDQCLGRPHRYRGGAPCFERPRGRWDALVDGWYRAVEGRVAFPVGVSLIAVASPGVARSRVREPSRKASLSPQRPQVADPLTLRRMTPRERGVA